MLVKLDASAGSPHAARARVREYLTDHGIDGQVLDAALLVVSELVSNAVQYGEAPITMCLERLGDGAVRVEVCDADDTIDEVRGVWSGELATSGRGLAIVTAYSTDWRVERRADGKSVVAEIAGP
jgi:anti-sigma regulatory factor (Ser/Thr protein kinase)